MASILSQTSTRFVQKGRSCRGSAVAPGPAEKPRWLHRTSPRGTCLHAKHSSARKHLQEASGTMAFCRHTCLSCQTSRRRCVTLILAVPRVIVSAKSTAADGQSPITDSHQPCVLVCLTPTARGSSPCTKLSDRVGLKLVATIRVEELLLQM